MSHIVQSPLWGQFKTKMGTPAIRVGDIQYTKHKIPLSDLYYGYAPKINPTTIDFETLKNSLKEENCVAINLDVPNVEKDTPAGNEAQELLAKHCIKAPKDTFAKSTIILDLNESSEEILKNMHKKHRYNIRYAAKKGVVVRKGTTEADFETFYEILHECAVRQKYFIHSKTYYKTIWEMFSKENKAHILIAEHEEKPLSAWFLFNHEDILYYPYGGSLAEKTNLQHSSAVGWAAIELGKNLGCHTFDMWGSLDDPTDTTDPWFGFTQFKMRFGGKHITFIDSYDFVINPSMYKLFNTANTLRWKVLKLIK